MVRDWRNSIPVSVPTDNVLVESPYIFIMTLKNDVERWLEQHCDSRDWKNYIPKGNRVVFRFLDENTAMMFKLAWGGTIDAQ